MKKISSITKSSASWLPWFRGLMDYAFDVLGFERLLFSNALGNEKSRRVKEKTGARFLRTEPGKFVNPSYTQREIWELTRDQWREFKARANIGIALQSERTT